MIVRSLSINILLEAVGSHAHPYIVLVCMNDFSPAHFDLRVKIRISTTLLILDYHILYSYFRARL